MAPESRRRREARWRGHGVASFLVRALVLVVPVGVGVAVAILVGSVLPPPASGPDVAIWWLLVIGSSSLAALLADRIARRLLPLAVLLKLTLVFPDRAPSRYVLARTAGNTRLLERRVRDARERGISDDPTRAAEMVLTLIAALGAHDRRTRGHSERVRAFTDLLGDELGLGPGARVRLRWSALLHDIGKLEVAEEILNKPGDLEEREWDVIRDHPEAGARLLGPLMPWLGEWGRAIPEHHERFNGSGYPRGIAGQEISLGARITAIADAYETMTAARTYKPPLGVRGARRELTRHAGTQFDPSLVRAFLNVSIGRLLWVVGPLTWLTQIPIVRGLARSGERQPVQAAASWTTVRAVGGVVALVVTGAIAPRSVDSPESADATPVIERAAEDEGSPQIEGSVVERGRRGGLEALGSERRTPGSPPDDLVEGEHAPGDPGQPPGDGPREGPGDGPGQPPGDGPGDGPGQPPGDGPGDGPGQPPGDGPGPPPGGGPGGPPGGGGSARPFDPPPLKPPPDPPPSNPPPVDPPPAG